MNPTTSITIHPSPEHHLQASQARHLDPHQARTRPPTTFEDLLGDAMERAFGQGLWELDALVGYLNKSGPLGPNGALWTAASFQLALKNLGE